MKKRMNNRAGFSLVEVALALLIISVGLIAAVGVLPGSLENSKRATDDTQQALIADYILNTFRTVAANTNVPWSSISPSMSIPLAAASMWEPITIKADGTTHESPGIVLKPVGTEIEEIDLPYNLSISDLTPAMKRVRLQLWAGSIKNTNSWNDFYADICKGDSP